MVKKINKALKKRIENLTWMSKETKKKALLKNKAFKAKIGYPNKWRNYNNLNFNNSSISSVWEFFKTEHSCQTSDII